MFIHENASENIACEMAAILSRGSWVKHSLQKVYYITDSKNNTCCFDVFIVIRKFYPYPSGFRHWHWGNHKIA